MINVADNSNFDLPNFKTTVKEGLNKDMRDEVIFEVLVEQLEYLSKADVARIANGANHRSKSLSRSSTRTAKRRPRQDAGRPKGALQPQPIERVGVAQFFSGLRYCSLTRPNSIISRPTAT